MFTFDFNRKLLVNLISQLSKTMAEEVTNSLVAYPFKYQNNTNPPISHITCQQTKAPAFSQKGEMFFPLEVIEFQVGSRHADETFPNNPNVAPRKAQNDGKEAYSR